MLIRLILSRNGVRLTCDCWQGACTLTRMSAHMPLDLILLDLTVSTAVSGYCICETIRYDPRFSGVPVVATAELNPVIGMRTARARGFFGYIGAPLNANLFPEQISTLLEGKPVWYGI